MNFKVNAKWILAGEHTVIRGGQAISFPLPKYSMQISEKNSIDQTDPVILDVIKYIERKLKIDVLNLCSFSINSNIPKGCGFGSSAALSVCISKWLYSKGACHDALKLALDIENLFHKNSSGLDVYSVYYNQPMIYARKTGMHLLETSWQPDFRFAIVDSEKNTIDCVNQVGSIWEKFPSYAENVDSDMQNAVSKCINALSKMDINELAEGMKLACNCFANWGLITEKVQYQIDAFYKNGALAAKPIGSGGGGGIVALFPMS